MKAKAQEAPTIADEASDGTGVSLPGHKPRRNDVDTLRHEIVAKLAYSIGKDPIVAQGHDWLFATILAVRDRIIDNWMASTRESHRAGRKRVYYFSLEFLIGRLLRDSLNNLGLTEVVRAALKELAVDLDEIS